MWLANRVTRAMVFKDDRHPLNSASLFTRIFWYQLFNSAHTTRRVPGIRPSRSQGVCSGPEPNRNYWARAVWWKTLMKVIKLTLKLRKTQPTEFPDIFIYRRVNPSTMSEHRATVAALRVCFTRDYADTRWIKKWKLGERHVTFISG